jgi:hypothetical protein
MQSIISNLKSDIISLELRAKESSIDSITIADKLTKALEAICMQQSLINDKSNTNSSLKTQLMLANATVISLSGIKKELESHRQKYSALVANKLKKVDETVLNLQAIIQLFQSHLPQNDDKESEIKRQKIEIASLRAQLHASPPSSSSSSQSVASCLPPSSSVTSIITPASRKRTIGEIDESIVHNDDDDYHSRLQLYIPVSLVPDVSLIDLIGSTRQSAPASTSSLPSPSLPSISSSSSSSSSSVETKNVGNETDYSNGRPRKIPSTSTTASANQRR